MASCVLARYYSCPSFCQPSQTKEITIIHTAALASVAALSITPVPDVNQTCRRLKTLKHLEFHMYMQQCRYVGHIFVGNKNKTSKFNFI